MTGRRFEEAKQWAEETDSKGPSTYINPRTAEAVARAFLALLRRAGPVNGPSARPGWEGRLDALFCAAFAANEKAMLDYVEMKFELRRLRAVAAGKGSS